MSISDLLSTLIDHDSFVASLKYEAFYKRIKVSKLKEGGFYE